MLEAFPSSHTLTNVWALPKHHSITKEQYAEFEFAFVYYVLKEYRYGQAFCEHFGLGNATPLYHFKDETISRRWVSDNYLQK